MGSEVEVLDERLKSLLAQLNTERGIFERIVYKNKNQHRRSAYFQYLLKVRMHLRLLERAKLEDILKSCFLVITGSRPKQKVNLLESLKRRKCDAGKYNFMERLLGAARLLSVMVEPMMKAAIEISILLARSFFTGFSITVLALLARLRVLVQQVLLDVVSVFNMVSSLAQKKQSINISHDGIEVFREFYPTNEEYVTLECIRETDNYFLHEKKHKSEIRSSNGDLGGDISLGASVVQYQSIESYLGDEGGLKTTEGGSTEEVLIHFNEDKSNGGAATSLDVGEALMQTECCTNVGDNLGMTEPSSKNLPVEDSIVASPSMLQALNPLKRKSESGSKVAFLSVKKPTTSSSNSIKFDLMGTGKTSESTPDDPFFSLLAAGNLKDSLI